jgi:hypothetical protein
VLAAGHPVSGAALDAPELFDVDVDQLARPLALIALDALHAQPAQPAHPDPREDARHRRKRHLEQLGDLRAGHPQPAQRRDRLHPPLRRPVGEPPTRRTAIHQAGL